VIEERKQGVKKKSFMVRDRNMYFFIYIPLEKRIFNHRKNEPFTYITIVTAYVVQWQNIYNLFLFSLPPTFTSNIELVMHFELTMKRGQIKPKKDMQAETGRVW
jgi:hypothetical protein